MARTMLTDKEVCAILRISHKTLRAVLKNGATSGCSIDLRQCRPITLGGGKKHGQRRWHVARLAAVTHIPAEELMAAAD